MTMKTNRKKVTAMVKAVKVKMTSNHMIILMTVNDIKRRQYCKDLICGSNLLEYNRNKHVILFLDNFAAPVILKG